MFFTLPLRIKREGFPPMFWHGSLFLLGLIGYWFFPEASGGVVAASIYIPHIDPDFFLALCVIAVILFFYRQLRPTHVVLDRETKQLIKKSYTYTLFRRRNQLKLEVVLGTSAMYVKSLPLKKDEVILFWKNGPPYLDELFARIQAGDKDLNSRLLKG
ncbi:MAG: hypothetical protein P8J32_07010 [bacterium]|jgi:hypothetical protein|nr:hypothetical protein [bacterium]